MRTTIQLVENKDQSEQTGSASGKSGARAVGIKTPATSTAMSGKVGRCLMGLHMMIKAARDEFVLAKPLAMKKSRGRVGVMSWATILIKK